MITNTKCECGHQNHLGTVLCEYCGKPLFEDEHAESLESLEMRYDGVARRSQKENPTILDRVWNFFSSVKVAIYLILATLLSSILGTILPQENTFFGIDPSVYYKETYGLVGEIYYLLGLSHTYETWWFITLLFMIGLSLIICSLDRVLPLYRALSKQQIRKHLRFVLRQKVVYQGEIPAGLSEEAWIEQAATLLRKKNYRIHRDGTALLAEKYRFSRWGPYVLHIGLIIFLLAALMRLLPGWHMDAYMNLLEGETKRIEGTPYFIKNEKFTMEVYEDHEMTEEFKARNRLVPKKFETQSVLYRCTADCDTSGKEPVLEEIMKYNIEVNKPLMYDGLMIYQNGYRDLPVPQLIAVKPKLINKQTGQEIGAFELSMKKPQEKVKLGDYTLTLRNYYPEFILDPKTGMPTTASNEPKVPAFIYQIEGPGLAAGGEPYLYFPRQIDKTVFRQNDINGALANKVELAVGTMEDVQIAQYNSFLNVREDRGLPFIWVGSIIGMIGLIMGFYWQHRRVWIRIDDRILALGAHTNKNWFGFRKEIATILHTTGIEVDPKSLNQGGVES
ncbi:cytochrome c biogenesis protein ResB [Paenibacillus sp. N1-5-1-14]|uniref:cytochrome c biogenesis protein ResB n=1 Tax=Paenibacillus radicibacter TaxID=2972488 RepID=UPI002158EB88|nr:cytochrome c biogenesis protein ResB [Paenibacillus radicibacter]MCR8642334.1 cytochrome c biogenesis protein ResB [Paenibacillus radicibacter]